MSVDSDYKIFIEDYKQKKFHRSYSVNGYDLYSYASNKGKFGVANILLDILIEDFSAIEFKLFFAIVNTLKQSTDFEESAVVYLKYSLFSSICTVNAFGLAVKGFSDSGLLIPTPKTNYYIVNPLYVNKFYKTKLEK